MIKLKVSAFYKACGICIALAGLSGEVSAATITSTVSVTIGTGGGVGPVIVPVVVPVVVTPTPVVAPVVDTATTGEVALPSGGDVISIQTSTFREIAPVPGASETAVLQATGAASTGNTTDSSNVSTRFSQGARAAAQIFGGSSSVAVTGVPDQTYNINLPGEASFSAGAESVQIAGFEHNAGATPQVSSSGSGQFSVAAQVADNAAGDAAVDGVGSVEQILAVPVVTQTPYLDITISYN